MEKMKVVVESDVGFSTPKSLEVSPKELVKNIKEQAAVAQATDANNVKLLYNGEVLDDNRRLKYYNISEGATLHLAPKHDDLGGTNPPYTFFQDLPMDFKSRVSYESKLIRCRNLPIRPINPRFWVALIPGHGKWKGRNYEVEMRLPCDYPFSPIKVHWVTPINHPNVFMPEGWVCLSLLKPMYWRPDYGIITVFEACVMLLKRPHYEGTELSLTPIETIRRYADRLWRR